MDEIVQNVPLENVDGTSVQDTEKPRVPQSVWFGFVAQIDFQDQMDVFRFLLQSPNYLTVHILHDRDIHAESGVRVNGDGSESQYNVGDIKAPHIHGICKLSKKITAKKLDERFANYLHFQRLIDPQEYALYMLHRTFSAIREGKTLYDYSELHGDKVLLSKLYYEYHDDLAENIASYRAALMQHNGDSVSAIQQLLTDGNYAAVKDIRAHAYFYSRYVDGR